MNRPAALVAVAAVALAGCGANPQPVAVTDVPCTWAYAGSSVDLEAGKTVRLCFKFADKQAGIDHVWIGDRAWNPVILDGDHGVAITSPGPGADTTLAVQVKGQGEPQIIGLKTRP